MSEFTFEVPGEPVAWQRAGRGKNGHHFTQEATRVFERRVRGSAGVEAMRVGLREPMKGPVILHIRAFFSALSDTIKRRGPETLKATRPDVDNIGKGVADALNGGPYVDDGQVAILVAEKWHAAGDEDPRTVIRVAPIVDPINTCPLCGAGRRS